MKKENVLNVIGTCMIIAGSSVIGAAVGTFIEYKNNEARVKELTNCIKLNNAAIACMKELVDAKNNHINDLRTKMFELQYKLDGIE